ncbi:MAG: S-layer homology domain-containing protein [Phascolarctobacterium sp.]|uniref:S-layer homology domain-containing protein n=1 Tax=Phascolarctobacterium sp. TaxID=2049039 RepID=UPI0026DD6E0A|nr:S-layer homology domain-containing protein [Phascolarctobacterium sp.]MDO4921795.1 S-layer homology domain-containing protein [Phascolarctobacterium sp.]
MKKSLVLAMAMALGVTASAYAANPFSDVPAGHWAYDSVNKLAAAGVIDGYGDATFGGDKLMTRYEMAQIVAKAMARGANVDKLAAEFADELDTLGVRVANLEKKADNVKITGQVRMSYASGDTSRGGDHGRLRTRLFINGAVNDDWTYTARLENNQYTDNNSGEDDTNLNWAFVSGKIGGIKVDAGRNDFVYTDTMDTRGDGIKLSYGKDLKLTGWALKGVSSTSVGGRKANVLDDDGNVINPQQSFEGDRIYVADLGAKLGVVNANVRYFKTDMQTETYDKEFIEAAVAFPIAKDLKLSASYFNGDVEQSGGFDDNGYLVGLNYKGAKASQVGSWGLYAKYSERPWATYLEPTVFAGTYATQPASYNTVAGDGYKGYEVGGNVTLAKNIVLGLKYTDFESREGDDANQVMWSEVIFTF